MKHILFLPLILLMYPHTAAGEKTSSKTYSLAEVSKHNSKRDCWLVIDRKVYDVTAYIPRHPAPPETILDYCGKDATKPFDTKNKGKPHASRAYRLLSTFEIGAIEETR